MVLTPSKPRCWLLSFYPFIFLSFSFSVQLLWLSCVNRSNWKPRNVRLSWWKISNTWKICDCLNCWSCERKKNTDFISWTKPDRLLPWITAMLLEEVFGWVVGNFCWGMESFTQWICTPLSLQRHKKHGCVPSWIQSNLWCFSYNRPISEWSLKNSLYSWRA